MKSTITHALAALVLAGQLSSCSAILGAGGGTGAISASVVSPRASARTLTPSGGEIADYSLSASGPSGATLTGSSASGSFSFTEVAAGTWSLSLKGYDSEGALLVSAETSVTVSEGETAKSALSPK